MADGRVVATMVVTASRAVDTSSCAVPKQTSEGEPGDIAC